MREQHREGESTMVREGCEGATHEERECDGEVVALFPGSPLDPTKNRKGGGEPGIDSHVIPWHDNESCYVQTSS